MRIRRDVVITALLALTLSGIVAPVSTAAPEGSGKLVGLQVEAMQAPYRVPGDDGRDHLAYQLQITNLMAVPTAITSVSVRDDHGERLQQLSGEALAERLQVIGSNTLVDRVEAYGNALVVMDVPVTPSHRVSALRTSVGYAVAPGVEVPAFITQMGLNWVAVSPPTPISSFTPPVLTPPLAGTDWVNSNAFGDPLTGHSGARMTKGSTLHANEAFAIDFIQFRNGASHTGNGASNSDYLAYGKPVLSSSTGTVVKVRDGMADVPPGAFPEDLTSVDDAGGNAVVVKVSPGLYLLYGHFIPGSVRVRVGDTVRVGQVLGKLGNSGNSTGPHLHFQAMDGPDVMNADSVPFVFTSFTRTGRIVVDANGTPAVVGPAKRFTNVYPVTLGVNAFSR